MPKKTKQGQKEGKLEDWIAEENLKSEAKRIRARIKETAQIAEENFWEYISGSFPEIANSHLPSEVAGEFGKVCREAVTAWYLANSDLDEKLITLVKSDQIGSHERRAIIGQNEKGWWAANPEPAIKTQDIEKIVVIFEGLPTKDELLSLLRDLGYKPENIAEGILRR
jgi:hypothetical protein